MYINTLRIQGMRHADGHEMELQRLVSLPPGPMGLAIADALTLFAASFTSDGLRAGLVRLGIVDAGEEIEVHSEKDGLPDQATFPSGARVAPLLADGTRQVMVGLELTLDPPLFGSLRELAAREPRLVTALGQSSRIGVRVGWLFSADLTAVAVSRLELRIGNVGFPTSGKEKPSWMAKLLADVATRFHRPRPQSAKAWAVLLFVAAMSIEPDERRGFSQCCDALAEPPFELGKLELVQVNGATEARFGPSLLLPRQFGPATAEALLLVHSVFVRRPDVLTLEAPGRVQGDPDAIISWLDSRIIGDEATMEQVLMVPGAAG